MNFEAAREAGEIYSYKRKKGLTVDPEDAMIAGICRVNDEAVLTRNINHSPELMESRLNLTNLSGTILLPLLLNLSLFRAFHINFQYSLETLIISRSIHF